MSRYIDADEFLENESEAYMRAQVNLAKEKDGITFRGNDCLYGKGARA